MAKAAKKKATKKVAKKTVKRKEPKQEKNVTAVAEMPDTMKELEFSGRLLHRTGSNADTALFRDGAEVFRASVKLDEERAVRRWINDLTYDGKLTEEEQTYLEDNPTCFNSKLRQFSNMLRDERDSQLAEKEKGPEEAVPEPGPMQVSEQILRDTPEELKEAAMRRLTSPKLLTIIQADMATVIAGEERLATLVFLYCVSRLMNKPLHLMVIGASSSGKSFTLERVIEFAPDECVMRANAITPNALFHLDDNYLRHRIVAGGERKRDQTDANADGTRILREMQASQRISKAITLMIDGEPVTHHIEKEGPIAYSETTTVSQVDEEDSNRCIIIHTDESQEQTIRIMEASDDRDLGETPQTEAAQQMRAVHHTMHRMLQRKVVVIPYVRIISRDIQSIVKHNLEIRRAWDLVKGVIQASALLHQFQRETDEQGRLIATLDDYSTARWLLGPWLGEIIEGQSTDAARLCLDRILAVYKVDDTFTVRELKEKRIGGESQLRAQWLPALERADVIEVEEHTPGAFDKRGRQPKQWKLKRADLELVGKDVLPDAERVAYLMENPTMVAPAGGHAKDEVPVVETVALGSGSYRIGPDGSATAITTRKDPPGTIF